VVGAGGDSNDARVGRDHADARHEYPGDVRGRVRVCSELVCVPQRAGSSGHDRRPAHLDGRHPGARDRGRR